MSTQSLIRRLLLSTIVLGIWLLPGLLRRHDAFAALSACGSDPTVVLSNGVTFDLSTSISDNISDVRHISYTLHIPSNASVTSVTYTDGTQAISSFTAVADENSGNYDSYTVVTTGTPNVNVTAYFTVLAVPAGQTATPGAPAQGHSGQTLHVHLHIA